MNPINVYSPEMADNGGPNHSSGLPSMVKLVDVMVTSAAMF
jgi:hypothetical protein